MVRRWRVAGGTIRIANTGVAEESVAEIGGIAVA